jgi:putative transposase
LKVDAQRHHRRSIRLNGYDYSLSGAYFITLVTYQHRVIFGNIVDGVSELSMLGQIVHDKWFRSSILRNEIQLHEDEFIIMPNHVHGIVRIVDVAWSNNTRPVNNIPNEEDIYQEVNDPIPISFHRAPHSLSSFIAGFKSAVTSRSSDELQISRIWQRNYYDHIIRNEEEFKKIWDYIDTNPQKWEEDRLRPVNFRK